MAKLKKAYFCQNCGFESAKWLGHCTSCGQWNTFVEELVTPPTALPKGIGGGKNRPLLVDDVDMQHVPRIDMGSGEMNRLLGGGLVPGSLVLIAGEPGIGKSTLSLQLALNRPLLKTLYVSGEESIQQIKLRADRIGSTGSACFLLSETQLEVIVNQAQELAPDIIVIDSIQTLFSERIESSPGSVSQIRECAVALLKYAKETQTPVFLIGHITKDGTIAGPKVLEHIVDVVLQFEGDTNYLYRILRSIKNRFGSTAEIAIFEMLSSGLREVDNPSEILISHRNESLSGVAISAMMDGIRPFLIETQALVSTAAYGTPQRSTNGFDARRMNMLLAVLEKRAGFRLAVKDVFLNIAGGIKVTDPAIDLAVASAILSSNLDVPIASGSCFAAEVGLTGEIRPVPHVDLRIAEAERLGFNRIFISSYNKKLPVGISKNIEVVMVGKMEELMRGLFTGS